MSSWPRTWNLICVLGLASLSACSSKVKVAGSSCASAPDCQVYVSCGRSPEGCTCEGGACYLDPTAPVTPAGCRGCHGSLANAAPPRATDGGEDTSQVEIGAHQRHLSGGASSRPVACVECHPVPATVEAAGHIDPPPAEVVFGPLAGQATSPTWDRSTARCTTYCHGATLLGGSNTTPLWTVVNGNEAACGTCHGLPPGGNHPASSQCETCHAPTAGPNQTIANPFTHVDGVLQVAGGDCTSCHGDSTRTDGSSSAPPRDLAGNASSPKVGAHLAHLTAPRSADVLCAACHRVPLDVTSPGHTDDADRTAELFFTGLAVTDGGTAPGYNFATLTCSNTYCHGASLTGGTRAGTAVWTGGSSEATCTACHGNPPPAPHPQDDRCGDCHPGYAKTGADTGTTVKATHVNGLIDTNVTCATCHGTAGRDGGIDPDVASAPPVGTRGETATTDRAVGAHLSHLQGGPWTVGLACNNCHLRPARLLHSDGTATVTFGALATAASATPVWNGTTCATSYCHGRFKNGNPTNAPIWTGTAQADCGTCHGTATNPRALGNHPVVAANSCDQCHPNYTGTTVDRTLHVNGVVDVINLTCTSCHGDETRVGVAGADTDVKSSPPTDSNGSDAGTSLGVGAHLSHVNPAPAGAVAPPLRCAECHTVPTTESHSDGVVQMTFGALSRSQSSTPTWTRSTATCSNAWCHGGNPLLRGGTRTSIVWNTGVSTDCTSCHGNPPPAPHPSGATCTPCHTAAYTKTGATTGTVDRALHLNGVIDFAGATCTSCHGDSTRPSVAGADTDQQASPPKDSLGSVAATSLGVGVHLAHVNPGSGAVARPVSCPECHGPSPTSNSHYDGTVQIAFGPVARAQVSSPTWTRATGTCANSWCHGGNPRLPGGTATSPVWNNNSTTDCTSCHGNPPPPPHSQNLVCSNCHSASYTRTGATTGTVDLALHVNGLIDVTNMTCTSCHGDGLRPSVAGADPDQDSAPPIDTLGNLAFTAIGVGAHESHVNPDGGVARPLLCPECHGPTPTSTSHSDAVVQMAFGPIASAQTSTPTWTRATATCASSWCHGGNSRLLGGNKTSIVWNTGVATDCVSCHGNPPPLPHPQDNACASCHPAAYSKTGATTGTVDLNLHVNGAIDVANLTCTSCHGDNTRPSISGADPDQQSAPPKDTLGNTASTALGVGAHFAHVDLAAGAVARPFTCAECHGPSPTSTSHSDSIVQMSFGALARAQTSTPTWTRATATCANSWCHGGNSRLVGGTMTSIVWNNSTVTDCTSCHGNPPPLPHSQNFACNSCHAAAYTRASATTGTVDMTQHVNGLIDVTNLTCTSCHGTAGRASVAGADPQQASSPPVDSLGNTATTALGVGDHLAHVNPSGAGALARPFTCPDCHGPTPTSNSHSDSIVQIAFGALARSQSSTPTWTRSTATCASSWCHGGNTRLVGGNKTSLVWNNNTAVDCVSCHGNPPPAPHVQNNACASCHPGYSKTGATTGTVNLATHVNGTIDTVALACTTCHGTVGRTGADPNIASAPPTGTAGETLPTTRAVGAHLAHLQGTSLRAPLACVECHTVPTAQTHPDGTATVTFGTLSRTRGATPIWNGTTCTTSYCHGSFANGNTSNAPSWTGGASQAACGTCHGTLADPVPGGTHPFVASTTTCASCHGAGYSRTTVDNTLHINGVVDGSGEPSTGGTSCGSCHATQFAGMTGGAVKVSKHSLGGGDNPVDPGGGWTSPLLSAAPYASASCVSMCHGDHPHDLTSPVVATHQTNAYLDASNRGAARTSATRASKDFDPAQANGGLCLSCHRFPIDANRPGIAIAAFNASAHDYTTNAQGTWTYTLHDGSTFARDCTKCHADRADGRPNDSSGPMGSVHYSDYPSLLSGTVVSAGAPATQVCNTCHGNGTTGVDLSGKDTATDFAKSQGHPVNADTRHNSVTEATLAYTDGKNSGANRHVNCLDCHDTHEAGPTSHPRAATATSSRNQIGAASPLLGVSGVNMTSYPALWGTTASGNFAYLPRATMEWQICFKCHTSFAFGASPPNGPSGLAETDLAQAFNPNNRSGHPVVTGLNTFTGSLSPKPLTAAQLLAPWNVNMGTQTMMCSDCHGSDSVAPAAQGPHGSASSFMLAGVNRTWPGNFTLSSIASGLGTPAGLFCNNCHPSNRASNAVHSKGDHSGARCTACHIVIPHGGKVSRLIATATAGLPARLQQTGVTVNITGFKKANGTNYARSDCSTNCSGHPAITSPETW